MLQNAVMLGGWDMTHPSSVMATGVAEVGAAPDALKRFTACLLEAKQSKGLQPPTQEKRSCLSGLQDGLFSCSDSPILFWPGPRSVAEPATGLRIGRSAEPHWDYDNSGSFQQSGAPLWTPNSRALIVRTPTKRTRIFFGNSLMTTLGILV